MPKLVKEISSGTQFSRSSNEGQLADSQNRAYRVILQSPEETIDIQQECQVRIGDQHPYNDNLYCVSFDARFEGDSRMVILVTFNYQSTPGTDLSDGGKDQKSQPPDLRPPNWTTSTSLMEQPLYTWRKRLGQTVWGDEDPAANPVGDIYDGVTRMVPVVTLTAQLFAVGDPTLDLQHAGKVNSEAINIGNLRMAPHTLMFRGVEYQPTVESWGGIFFSGWNATYEFAFKKNETKVRVGGASILVDLGWDIAVPQSGFNVKCFNVPGNANQDPFGQPLEFDVDGQIAAGPVLSEGLNAGDKARAMVRVPIKKKSSQAPSASPIPLNDDGTPRAETADPKVLVYGYAVQPEMDFRQLGGGRVIL